MRKAGYTVVLAVACFGCGSDQKSAAPGREGTPGELADRVAAMSFSFSFVYDAPPPEGRRVRAGGVTGADACSLAANDSAAKDFSAFVVAAESSVVGTYPIVPKAESTFVEWVRVQDSKVVMTARAVGGEIGYLAGPDDEAAWRTTRSADFDVRAEFEVDPVVRSECSGSQNSNGEIFSSCECRRLSGSAFTCDAARGTCCHDEIGEVESVRFSFTASACPSLCRFAGPDLAAHCRDLQ